MGIAEKRNKLKEMRRQSILKAARKLFFEKGFRHVSVENIAKKANISKGAVYLHFKSKDEIYTHLLLSEVDRHQRIIKTISETTTDPFEAIKKIVDSYVNFFLVDPELFRILMNYMLHPEHLELSKEMDEKLVKAVNENIDTITHHLNVAVEKGTISRAVNIFYCRNAIWGMINGIIALHLFTGAEGRRAGRIRETVEQGIEIYLRGLQADKLK